ncbi:MAG: YggT family protein, partial [Pseudomonadota bacterium]
HLLIAAVLLRAVLSWVAPYAPINALLVQLTHPFVSPVQRIVPPIAAVDLSPLIVLLLAQVALMFV